MSTLELTKAVYGADEVQTILGLGRSKTYLFLEQAYEKQSPFRVLKIGKLYRIPKESFDQWLYGN